MAMEISSDFEILGVSLKELGIFTLKEWIDEES